MIQVFFLFLFKKKYLIKVFNINLVTETTLNETSDLNVTKRRAKRGSTVVLSDFEASNSLLDSTCMPESFNLGPVQSPEPETKATEEPLEPEPIPEPVVVKAVSKPKRKYKKKSKIVAGTT